MNLFWDQVDNLGRKLTTNIDYTAKILLMVYLSVRSAVVDQAQGLRTIFGVVSAQIYFTGWQAMPLISLMAVASGALIILQSTSQFNLFGGSEMVGNMVVIIIVRELGPLITALIVIARSGTAVASEVGNMRANREIEALESMGINPLSFIVFPRLAGGVVSVICLAIYFTGIAILGGYLATRFLHDMPLSFYLGSIAKSVAFEDVWLFLLKNTFSGVIIFVISCYQGLSVKRSPTEVPVVTTQAVVKSIIYVVIFNITVSALFYLGQLIQLGVI